MPLDDLRRAQSSSLKSIFIAAVLCSACKSREAQAPPAAAPVAVPANTPSFKTQIVPYFAQTCASANSCHGAHPSQMVDLDLRAPTAYAQLVGHYSEQRVGGTRVKPGDVEGSFLVAKLSGNLRRGEGKPMPLDPQTGQPMRPIPFDADFIDNVVKPWIAAGAPNN